MKHDFNRPPCIIYKGPIENRNKLRDLTIPLELLVEAAQQGFVERLNAIPPFDPVTAAGTDAWRYPVRAVRGGLHGLGWRLDDPRNLPLAISDKRRINVTVSSGDEFTGVDGLREPRTKNPKGALIEEAVSRNIRQKDFFPEQLPQAVRKFGQTLQYPTWVFLLYITDEIVRAELSLPNSISDGDYINGWGERVFIDVPIPGDELADDTDYDDGLDIRPVVTPKI